MKFRFKLLDSVECITKDSFYITIPIGEDRITVLDNIRDKTKQYDLNAADRVDWSMPVSTYPQRIYFEFQPVTERFIQGVTGVPSTMR